MSLAIQSSPVINQHSEAQLFVLFALLENFQTMQTYFLSFIWRRMIEIAVHRLTNFPLECETRCKSRRGLFNCVGKCDDKQAGGLSLLSLSLDKLRTLFIAPQSREKY